MDRSSSRTEDSVERLREMLAGCRRCAVFTGAGIGTEIIDASGAGNPLDRPRGIAVDGAGNVYVTGGFRDNAFQITPRPFLCEGAMSQRTYMLDETLEMATVRFANLDGAITESCVRRWIEGGVSQ